MLIMASGVVRSSISTVVEQAPSGFDRSSKLKQFGKEIMENSCDDDKKRDSFDKFSQTIVSFIKEHISTVSSRYKSTSGKRTSLWSCFHKLRTTGDGFLRSSWKTLLTELNVSEKGDWILMQRMYRQIFEDCMRDHFTATTVATQTPESHVTLTGDELNALRYACGYVAHSLLKKFEKQRTRVDKFSQFITCLGEMAVVGEGDNLLTYTEKWFDLVNRGGLFPLNNHSFAMFIEIKKCVRVYLPKHMLTSSSDKESFKQNVHDKVTEKEDVQFYWAILSQDIDDPDHAQELLGEIIKLWVTVRGFSMTATWMKIYKRKEKKRYKKQLN